MSEHLNFSRLSLLLKNHIVEHKQRYLYYAAGMFFIGLIIMMLCVSFNHFPGYANIGHTDQVSGTNMQPTERVSVTTWEAVQTILYLSGLSIFAVIFSSVSFVNFNNKGEAIFYLIKPASQLEKWLTEIIVHVFLFFAAYTLIFYLLDIPVTLLIRSTEYSYYLEEMKTTDAVLRQTRFFHPSSFFHFSTLSDDAWIAYPVCISIYLTGTAFFMYGAVLFNRFSFFKTLILGFVTAMLYVFYSLLVFENTMSLFSPADWRFTSIFRGVRNGENFSFEVKMADHWMWTLIFSLMFIVPMVLFACSYFKLKEKEV